MSEVDTLKVEVYDQKKRAEQYWQEAREAWNKVTSLNTENQTLRDENARLKKALEFLRDRNAGKMMQSHPLYMQWAKLYDAHKIPCGLETWIVETALAAGPQEGGGK